MSHIEGEGRDRRLAAAEASVRLGVEKERLRIRASWLSRLIEVMPVALLVAERDGTIREFNPMACDLFGYDAESFRRARLTNLLPESCLERLGFGSSELAAMPVSWRIGDGVTMTARRIDGSLFPIEIGFIPIEERGRTMAVLLVTDATCRKSRNCKLLVDARGKAAFSHLASAVAHQINNPLAAMKFGMHTVRKALAAHPETSELLDLIATQLVRIEESARVLTDLAQANKTGSRHADLRLVITRILSLFTPAFEDRRVRVHFEVAPGVGLVAVPEEDLVEVVMNLVENAREALSGGSSFSVRAFCHASRCHAVFEDDGPGLGPDPERVFGHFYTTKPDGSGIGLAVSRELLERAQGRLRAENRDEGGARFTLDLPLYSLPGHA